MVTSYNIFKHTTLLKVLTLVLAFMFSKSWGQAILPVSRTAWGSVVTGWTTTGTTTYATEACSGAAGSSCKLDNATDNVVVNYNTGASSISFCVKGNTGSGAFSGTFLIQESSDGVSWTVGQNIPVTTTGGSQTFNLSCSSTYVRFYFSVQTNGNIALDDVSITQGTCTACTAPSTTITPTTPTVCAGTITSFTVTDNATSAPTAPSYQWQMSSNGTTGWANVANGTPTGASYSGATTNSLAITAGATYYYKCLVTDNNTPCTATSGTSTLVVNSSPTITTQPVNKSICSGSNASFTVVASGSPLTYLWQENTGSGFTNITNGGAYSGATTATLTLTAPPTSMTTYSYQCLVSVAICSSTTTSAAVLTINTIPATPPVPSPVSNPACTTGTLSASSSTVAGVTWYWQGTTAAGISTTSVSSSSYTFSSSGNYYIRALDASGTCWSSASNVSVTVNTPVTITTQPIDKEVCMVGNTSFAIVGAGTAPKQWQYSSDGGLTFTNVPVDAVHSNVTSATMNLTAPTTTLFGYVYQCVVSVVGCPAITSNTAILTVYATPAAPPTPTALANPACSGTSLTAMTSTVAGVTWYWQGTTAAGSSTTSPTSSIYNVSASGTYYVRARADGSSCLSTSSNTVITVNAPPAIVTQPTDKVQCVGTNTTFAISATGTSLTYLWQINTGSGFTGLTNVAPYSNVTTATMSITGITAGMNGYLYQCVVSGASPCATATSNSATLTITASGVPTTPASSPLTTAIGCNAFNLSWTNGNGSNRLVVVSTSPVAGNPVNGTSYAASTTFGSGGTIAAGEFVIYKGTGSSVYITGLLATTTYYYKIFEFNGCSISYLTSGSIPSGNITTTSCSILPGVTGVYVDACAGGCGYEGNNELVWGVSGSYGLSVFNNGPTLHYNGAPSPPTTTYISTYGQYASNITALNAAVGGTCATTTFVDPNTQGFIPPNSKFLVAHSCLCIPAAYDFLNLCGSGPIYVLFGNDAAWPCNGTGGIFGNSGATIKYFDLDLSTMGVTLDPIYNFIPNNLTGGDGAYALFSPAGGAATTYSNSGAGCVVPMTILPLELIDFYGTQNGDRNDLIWKIASEKNVVQYIIEKSEDGVHFTEISRVNAKATEGVNITYSCEDSSPYSGITYYRLNTLEINNKKNRYKIIYLDRDNKDWKSLFYQQDNFLYLEFKNAVPKNSTVSLYDLSGKLMTDEIIKESQTKINIQNFSNGIYFLKISTPYKTENFKLIISK